VSPQPTTAQPPFEEVAQRARELNEQILEAAREAGENHFKAYEAWLKGVAAEQKRLAEMRPGGDPGELAIAFLKAQAEFNKQMADSLSDLAKASKK
jgi:hypothetical protein